MSRSLMNRMRGSLVMYSCVAAFVITVGILLLLYAVKGYAPFGGSSMACMDADVQYLDFFAYLRQVLVGEDHLGYPINGENMCIVNTSILGADALLGVKYVLSPYAINGLELRDELETQNGKQVYENPYALPMAFVFEGDIQKAQKGANPFEYQNQLYSQLMGEPVEPQLLGDCMYVIPQVDGGNTIEMNYQIPGLKAGAALTLVGVAMLAGYWMVNRRKKNV